MNQVLARGTGPLRAANTAVFLLKVFPMLPSRPVDWVTPPPVVERVRYPTARGWAEGDLYRPAAAAPTPALSSASASCPFAVEHPQVPRLGAALARCGLRGAAALVARDAGPALRPGGYGDSGAGVALADRRGRTSTRPGAACSGPASAAPSP